MPKKKVIVVQDEDAPIEVPVLAEAIVKLSKGVNALLKTGLLKNDLVTLLNRRAMNVKRRDIVEVLEGLEQLADDYKPMKK